LRSSSSLTFHAGHRHFGPGEALADLVVPEQEEHGVDEQLVQWLADLHAEVAEACMDLSGEKRPDVA